MENLKIYIKNNKITKFCLKKKNFLTSLLMKKRKKKSNYFNNKEPTNFFFLVNELSNRDIIVASNEGLLNHKNSLIKVLYDIIDIDCEDGTNYLVYLKELFSSLRRNGIQI